MPKKAQPQPRPVSAPSLLTVGQVAAQLQVGRDTVYRLVKAGQLRPVFIGKSLRVSIDDLAGFLEDLRRTGKVKPYRYPSDEQRGERRERQAESCGERAKA